MAKAENWKKGRAKTGGRQKGTPNKRTEIMSQTNMTPLQFMGAILAGKKIRLRDPDAKKRNAFLYYTPTFEDMKWAAQHAAPFVHPRLAHIKTGGNVGMSHEDWLNVLDGEDPVPSNAQTTVPSADEADETGFPN